VGSCPTGRQSWCKQELACPRGSYAARQGVDNLYPRKPRLELRKRGRDFWLDEDDWVVEEAAASRRGAGGVDVHVYRSGLQPGAREEPAGGSEGVGSGIPEGPETPRGKEKKPRCLRKIPLHA